VSQKAQRSFEVGWFGERCQLHGRVDEKARSSRGKVSGLRESGQLFGDCGFVPKKSFAEFQVRREIPKGTIEEVIGLDRFAAKPPEYLPAIRRFLAAGVSPDEKLQELAPMTVSPMTRSFSPGSNQQLCRGRKPGMRSDGSGASVSHAMGATALFFGVVVFIAGCGGPSTTTPTVEKKPTSSVPSAPLKPSTAEEETPPPVETAVATTSTATGASTPRTLPQVLLSQTMRQSCVVWVGDLFPGGRLTDLSGEQKLVREQFGPRLTVVLFWSTGGSQLGQLAAQTLLADLEHDVAQAFANDGLRAIAINVGDPPEVVKAVAAAADTKLPVLLDAAKAYFALVAREYLPRIYLLDSQGRVLWLDLQFSEFAGPTREKLLQAIQVALSMPESRSP